VLTTVLTTVVGVTRVAVVVTVEPMSWVTVEASWVVVTVWL
jgi:hypothetical protein